MGKEIHLATLPQQSQLTKSPKFSSSTELRLFDTQRGSGYGQGQKGGWDGLAGGPWSIITGHCHGTAHSVYTASPRQKDGDSLLPGAGYDSCEDLSFQMRIINRHGASESYCEARAFRRSSL
jgi:hypothetical protein